METEFTIEALEFVRKFLQRLEQGAKDHPDSLDRPPEELLKEVEDEMIDIPGWSYILWLRLQKTKAKLEVVQAKLEAMENETEV